ncbi:glutamate dehydrogenase [Flavobacterium agricola]|uniref:Glutamate dehydrogenase n=1 Tax=Flavobacterium agricola TaxID=2870839 RepID=A0ABY6LXL3_9FLAO|nr:glutamate dehydrogenase [Flavobacterium agricola]UYW01072.1 glutamate dehydrogenase [Flavobacterium agricola]
MSRKNLFLFLFVLGTIFPANAQANFSHEIGVIAGPVNFRSDFGQRNNSKNNFTNTGFGVGLVHYMNFSYTADCNCYRPETYFNDHFKIRTELNFNKTNLKHEGQWVQGDKTFAKQLRAMKGETTVFGFGMQLEYYPFSIREFSYNVGSLAPYVSLGAQYNFFKPKVWSDYGNGDLNDPAVVSTKYVGALSNDSGSTFSIVSSVGTRYKLSTMSDLLLDLRWQYYFSDWVDGMNPDRRIYKENKANDWVVWLNVGYIYYLN